MDFFNMSGISEQIEAGEINDDLDFSGPPQNVIEVEID